MWRQIRRHPKVQTLLRMYVDLTAHCNSHIPPHYARRDQHWWELVLWITTNVLVVIAMISFLDALNEMYDEKNTGIEVNVDYLKFVSTVPAFTFCPEPLFDEQLLAEFLQRQEELYGVKRQDTLSLLEFFLGIKQTILPVINYNIDRKDYMQLALNLSQRGYVKRLDGVQGVKVLTDAGLCYTFNSRLTEAVDLFLYTDLGQKLPRFRNATPTFDYYDNFPISFKYRHNFTGKVKLFIHSPDELPIWWTRPSATIEPGQNLRIAFEMRELTYEEDVITKSPLKNRKCRTRDESNLIMNPKFYSRHLCLMDCQVKQSFARCGCVPFFYANRELRGKSWKLCDVVGFNCFLTMDNLYCLNRDCLPNCAQMDVNVFDPTSKGMPPRSPKSFGKSSDIAVEALLIYPPVRQLRRRIFFTNTDYFVSFGSLLSLLEGNNLLSTVELIFCFTLRLFWFWQGYPGAVEFN